jgi:hypothetical protein
MFSREIAERSRVDVSSYPAGLYFVNIRSVNGIFVKVIKVIIKR